MAFKKVFVNVYTNIIVAHHRHSVLFYIMGIRELDVSF